MHISLPTAFALWAIAPLGLGLAWVISEFRTVRRALRMTLGILFVLSTASWVLGLSNSVGAYYGQLREHRLIHSVIHAYPRTGAEIEAWATRYPDRMGVDVYEAHAELGRIVRRLD